MTLTQLGWSPVLDAAFQQYAKDGFIPGRVYRQDKQSFAILSQRGELTATLLGRLLYAETDQAELPAVGDWVAIQPFDDGQGVIHAVLPRFSAFYRKEAGSKTRRQVIAANIDIAFLVSGLDNDFNVRRIERYLVQTQSSGSNPVIVLNKADLCDNLNHYIDEVKRIAPDVEVLPVSALQAEGIQALSAYIGPGKTVAFLGSSGVGKSSLVNGLLGHGHLKTGAVREDDSRGRHTTSHRELKILPDGGIVIDTPGLRELQLWGDADDLHAVFTDIEELSEGCRFRDCWHVSEPNCAVQEALIRGDLDEDRFQSYLKLKRELAYLDLRIDEAAQQKAKRREKKFGRLIKEIKKHNPKR